MPRWIKKSPTASAYPMMQQYLAIKEQHPASLVFYRTVIFTNCSLMMQRRLRRCSTLPDQSWPIGGGANSNGRRALSRGRNSSLAYSTQALLWSSANKSVFLGRQRVLSHAKSRISTPGTVTDDAFVDSGQELWVASTHSHGPTHSVALTALSHVVKY